MDKWNVVYVTMEYYAALKRSEIGGEGKMAEE